MPDESKHSTRDGLLDAAEALFADRGIAGTSLRAVTGRAGANLAAVNYHFGSKKGLVREVFRRRLAPINQQRLQLLESALGAAAPGPASVEELVEIFLAPVLDMGADHPERARSFKRLMGRVFSEPGDAVSRIVKEEFGEVGERFLRALGAALPELPRDVLLWRFHFMIGTMLQVTLNSTLIEKHTGGVCDPFDTPELLARLVEFVAAGFRASVVGFRSADGNAEAVDSAARKSEAEGRETADDSSIFPWEEGF